MRKHGASYLFMFLKNSIVSSVAMLEFMMPAVEVNMEHDDGTRG